MLPNFVDKASAYLLQELRSRFSPKDRAFSRLAREIGVTPQLVQKWYHGERGSRMPLSHVQGLARVLGISMVDVANAVGDDGAAKLFRLLDQEPEVMSILSESAARGGEYWEKIKAMIILMRQE